MSSYTKDMLPKSWEIFKSSHSGRFNACVGENSLHDLKTYADGYMEASVMLLHTVLDKCLIGQMDTLVHPILYSARHAIELTIKCVLFELNKCDLKTDDNNIAGHSLSKLWLHFEAVANKDSRLLNCYNAIDPILKALDAADPDAQDFRYPTGNAQEGKPASQTLQGKRIVDLETVRDMLELLEDQLDSLHLLSESVARERLLGTFTQDLNRDELKRLAIDCCTDTSLYFVETRVKWQRLHGLSKRGFRRATDFIAKHREFAGYTGKESELIAISPELLDEIVEFKLNDIGTMLAKQKDRKKNNPERRCIAVFDIREYMDEAKEEPASFKAYHSLKDKLTPKVVAELEALYYLSYLFEYSENYQSDVENKLKGLNLGDDETKGDACMRGFLHIFKKANLMNNLIGSLALVGQNTKSKYYAEQLASLECKFMDEKSEATA